MANNNQLDPLDVKHRYERMNRDFGLKLNPEYFATIHNRSLPRVYSALKGEAPALLKRINKHLDVVEERETRKLQTSN